MRLRVITAAAMLLASLSAQAGIPYKDSVYEFKQPGGEKLRVHLDGNDYYAEQRTDDGSLVVYDAAKKGFCYATLNAAGDELVSTGVLATNAKVRSLAGTAKKQEGLSQEARARKAKEKFEKMNGRSLESARKSASAALSARDITSSLNVGR